MIAQKIKFPKYISKPSYILLNIFLPMILFASLYTFLTVYFASPAEFFCKFDTYLSMLEHIFMSIVLLLGGVIICDLAQKEAEENEE